MTDEGAKKLIAAILRQAHDDYTKKEKCPSWCTYINDCRYRDNDHAMSCEVKKFIKSAWCASLCNGIDLDPDKFRSKMYDKKMTQTTARKVEEEIRNYQRLVRELETLKRDIILESPAPQEGRSTDISRPTESAVAKIFTDRRIKTLGTTIAAIDAVLARCSDTERRFIDLYYWSRKYTIEGVSLQLDCGPATIKRWKRKIIRELALELGYI